MTTLTFVVAGPVVPKQRPRFARNGHVYTPPKTRSYEMLVTLAAGAALRKHGEWDTTKRFALSLVLFMGDKRKRDLDNCAKAISDALNGVLYDDDAQIDELFAIRNYDKDNPRAVVALRVLEDE